jgi:hypothetical protein
MDLIPIYNGKEMVYINPEKTNIFFSLEGNDLMGYKFYNDYGKPLFINKDYNTILENAKNLMEDPKNEHSMFNLKDQTSKGLTNYLKTI